MPDPVSITCPYCNARLKLKDSSKLGQRIGCPKCKKPFTAVAPAEDDLDFEAMAALAEDTDEDDDLPAPASRSSRARSGGSKGRSQPAQGGSKAPLIIGGVAAVAVVAGLAIWLTSGKKEGPAPAPAPDVAQQTPKPAPGPGPTPPPPPTTASRNKLDASWLPPQSELIIYVRPAEILASPFVNWAVDTAGGRQGLNEALEKTRQELAGVSADDIESVTLGFKSLSDITGGAANLGPAAMMNPMALSIQAASGMQELAKKEFACVIRLKKPLDLAKVPRFQQEGEPVSYGGVTYFRNKSKDGQTSAEALYQPSPTVIVLTGREEFLKSAIDRKGAAELRPEIAMIEPSCQLVFAGIPGDRTVPAAADGNDPLDAAYKLVQGLSLGIKATEGIELHLAQSCKNTQDAQQVKAAADGLVAKGKEQLALAKATMPPTIGQIAETLLDGLKTTQQDRFVTVSTGLPKSSRESLQVAAGEVMMLVMGGLAGGLAGMPAGDGAFTAGSFGDEGSGEAVVVDQLEGLPEGVTLQAKARWSPFAPFTSDGKQKPRPLQLELAFVGAPVAKTIAFGQLKLTKLESDPPTRLKRASGFLGEHPERKFVDVGEGDPFGGESAEAAKLTLDFEPPAAAVTQFTRVEGTIVLRVAEESKDILLPDVMAQVDKPVKDPDLQAAGFTSKMNTEFGMKRVVFSFDRGNTVGDFKFVGAGGQPLEDSPFLMRQDLANPTYSATLDEKGPPAGMAARIVLHTKVKEISIPFQFADVPIPPREKLPEKSADDWVPTTLASDLPPGLAVEARLQWQQGFNVSPDGKRLPPNLGLAVDVTGPQALRTVGIGFWKFRNIRTDTGPAPVLRKSSGFVKEDPTQEYTRPDSTFGEARLPPDGVQALLMFEGTPAYKQLVHIDGSFKLATFKESKTIVFDKLSTRFGKALPNAELRPFGIELKLAKQGQTLGVQVTKGNPLALANVTILRDKAPTSPDSPWNFNPEEKTGYIYITEEKFTPKDALEVTVYSGLEETEIPFSFDNLDVPPPPKEFGQ